CNSNAGRFYFPFGSHSARPVDGKEQKSEGQGTSRRRGQAAVGPERAGDGRISRGGTADGGEYSMDDRRGKCVFSTAKGCDGRRATYARKGAGHRESQDRFGTESGDQKNRKRSAGDCS